MLAFHLANRFAVRFILSISCLLVPLRLAAQPVIDGHATGSTREAVEAFVDSAAGYVGANGRADALRAFMDPAGPFHDGELYIYAYMFDGTVIAHGGDPSLVGRNLIGLQDANGLSVIRELANLARNGGGWLEFIWPNPQRAGLPQRKIGYVRKIDDTWFIGSGTYLSDEPKPSR